MITPYVTIPSMLEFSRNKTGFGYMVMDIACALGQLEEVDVLATDTRGDKFEYKGVSFYKRSFVQFIRCLFFCLPLSNLRYLKNNYCMPRGTFVRLMYYWLTTGYLKSLIKKGNYDIVHIHGCSFATELWIQVCKSCGQKFVVTLHGLNSFSETVLIEPAGKKYEKDFLKRVTNGEIPITVISTGMKKIIESYFGCSKCQHISVVCNAFSFNEETNREDLFVNIREQYGLAADAFIVLCIGNVCVRKNQGQLLRAFDLLPSNIAEKTYILFLGGETDNNYTIKKLSANSKYSHHFITCGIVEKGKVFQYYKQGNAVALMSLSEGFGLSLIEGMHFGLPCMSFTDIDAYEDIYNPCVMIGVKHHNDKAVSQGLEELICNKWNSEVIKNYSKKYTLEIMAKNYLGVYNCL